MGIESPYVTVTYKQLSEILDISYHATLQRVKRNKGWFKSSNNRGNTYIKIPRDEYVTLKENVTKNKTCNKTSNVTSQNDEKVNGIMAISKAYENERNERLKVTDKLQSLISDNATKDKEIKVLQDALSNKDKNLKELQEKHYKLLNRNWWQRLLNKKG